MTWSHARVDSILSIESKLALARIMLAENRAGDKSITIESVWERMDQALMLSQALLQGFDPEQRLAFPPIEEPAHQHEV